MKLEYELVLTMVDILLNGPAGAAINAIREDYPELAAIVNNYQQSHT